MSICGECERDTATEKYGLQRGLCSRCYDDARYAGTIEAYPTRWQSVCDEYQFLSSSGVPFREIAARLGMKPPSLARRLARHGNPVPPGGWVK